MGPVLKQQVAAASREGVSEPDIAVIIRSHQDTPTGLVQELISKCQESDLQTFSLRVKEKLR